MPGYIYAVMFALILVGALYIVFMQTKKYYLSFILRVLAALLSLVLSILALYSVSGGNEASTEAFLYLITTGIGFAFLESLFIGLTEYKFIKLKEATESYISLILSGLSMLSVLVGISIFYGFNLYSLIFFVLFLIIFYYVDVYMIKLKRTTLNNVLITIYGAVISYAIGIAISSLILSSVDFGFLDKVSLFLAIGLVLYYLSDLFNRRNALLNNPPKKKAVTSLNYYREISYFAGLLFIAVSVCFIFF